MKLNKVLLISQDIIGKQMAGPGIRYYQMAKILARFSEVTLAIPKESRNWETTHAFALVHYTQHEWDSIASLIEQTEILIIPSDIASDFPQIAKSNAYLVIDGYVPALAEWLMLSSELEIEQQQNYWWARMNALNHQYLIGDFYICGSERQRDWWLGLLEANGRIQPYVFRNDRSLRELIDVCGTGIPHDPPKQTRGIIKGLWKGINTKDKVILWGGGLWPWLDPFVAIEAMKRVSEVRDDVKLIFPGTRRPTPFNQEAPSHYAEAVQRCTELGLLNKTVFFGDWVDFEDWPNVLLETDIALSLHYDTYETRLAFRTRVLDYIWAEIPVISTIGDATSDLIKQFGIGKIVSFHDVEGLATAILVLLEDDIICKQQFEQVKTRLTWERTLQPLINFCKNPWHSPDKLKKTIHGSPFYAQKMQKQAAQAQQKYEQAQQQAQQKYEQAQRKYEHKVGQLTHQRNRIAIERDQLQQLVRGYEAGRFIRFTKWLKQVQEQPLGKTLLPPDTTRGQALLMARQSYNLWKSEGTIETARRIVGVLRTVKFSNPTQLLSAADAYQAWIKRHEPDSNTLHRQRQLASHLAYQPLISIITPVYNPEPSVLRDTIESVLAQTYPKWELCLADGNSDKAGVREVLQEYGAKDQRIRVAQIEKNLGISHNSNQALKMAQGEFIALLDHDDLLSPDMLYNIVETLESKPETDIIYFDEDKISEDGITRHQPWFKPSAWSPNLLLSTNYLMHSVIRYSLFEQYGGFEPALDGAQDWDLMLRFTEHTQKMVHIPRVFYHWRQVQGSTARDANAKPWALSAQTRCLEAHLKRINVHQARVVSPSLGTVRIIWPVSGNKVSIIIPTKDKVELLRDCVSSILACTNYPNYEIIIVDTGSRESATLLYYAEVKANPSIKLIEFEGEFNFSKVNNFAVTHADGTLLLFLNNDTKILHDDWLNELVGWAERPEVGVVGCKLIRPDGTIQHAGMIMGLEGHGSHIYDGDAENRYGVFGTAEWYRDYQAVTGACMMMQRAVFEQLHGFDEHYKVGYGDIELCLRAIEFGYHVIYTPFARLIHHEGGTRGFTLPPADVLRATLRMLPYTQNDDPYYNPNLSYNFRQPVIQMPKEELRAERMLRILRGFDLVKGYGAGSNPDFLQNIAPLLQWLRTQQSQSTQLRPPIKKLLFVSHEPTLTGAPLILLALAKWLVTQGFSITLVAPFDGPLRLMCEQAGIDFQVENYILLDARASAVLLKDYDLLLTNTLLTWRAIFAAKAIGKPSIWWIHESKVSKILIENDPSILKAFPVADAIVCPTNATASIYQGKANTIKTIYYGLDTSELPALPSLPSAQAKSGQDLHFYIVMIGSIEPRKGQDTFLEALQQLPHELRSQVRVELIGRSLDKTFKTKIEKTIKKLTHVTFTGGLTHEQTLERLKQADLFVLASRDEAFPIVLMEAMYYAKPIISTRAGGIDEMIEHNQNGLLCPIEDAQALAGCIRTVMQEPELAQELGRNAQKTFFEKLTISQLGQAMGSLIQQLQAQRNSLTYQLTMHQSTLQTNKGLTT